MQSKKNIRIIRNYFARLALRAGGAGVLFIPLSFLGIWGEFLGRLFYCFSARYRELAGNNLKLVFPDKKEDERSQIMKTSFVLLGRNSLETIWFVTRSRKKRINFIRLEGREFLDFALEERDGVIAVTAHIGAFTILAGALAAYGYCVNCLLRTPRDEKMADVLGRGLRMQNVRPIFTQPALRCVEESIKVLRRNEILIILIDQDIGETGVFVNFFGRPASTPAGPVIFSLRTQAKILPMFMLREDNRHKVLIKPKFNLRYGENAEKTIFENIQRLTQLVENTIREHPHQWSWVDRRWKTRPRNHAEPRNTGYA
jgi:KDO2-lipid IV(A) lauroyltransferase